MTYTTGDDLQKLNLNLKIVSNLPEVPDAKQNQEIELGPNQSVTVSQIAAPYTARPMKASHLGLSVDRRLVHLQTIVFKKATFDIELSWEKMKFFILVRRHLRNPDPTVSHMFLKWIWVPQARQLIKLFRADLTQMVNGLIKITRKYEVDFSFIDRVTSNIVGIDRNVLQTALVKLEDKKTKGFIISS
jgi:hypothetical protein